MKKSQIAAQLYTVRDHLKTEDDVARSLGRLRRIGYEVVELAAVGGIETAALDRMLRAEGLQCCSAHEPGNELLDNPSAVAERLGRLGCRIVAYPYPAGIDFSTPRSVTEFARRLGGAGAELARAGVTLAYHNHQIEFRKVGGRLILETLYEETDASALKAELDTFWIQNGGGDPVGWCRRMAGRLPILHLKDYGIDDSSVPVFRDVGGGNLSWAPIIKAAEDSGCRWFVIEQDSGWLDNDPFASLEASFRYVTGTLC